MEFKYAGYGLDVVWTRLPDEIRSVAVGARRTGPMVIACRFDAPSSFDLRTSGLFIANIRSVAPFELSLGERSETFASRAFALVGPAERLRCVFAGPHEGEFVSVPPDVIGQILGPEETFSFPSSIGDAAEDAAVRHLMRTIESCLARREEIDPFAYEAILTALVRLASVRQVDTRRPPSLNVDQACAVRAMILDGLAGPLSVGELARALRLSEGHFARAFKESFGAAPYNYILRERVLRARALLAEQSAPLEAIARQAGFTGVAQMTRALKAHAGATARALRASSPAVERSVPNATDHA